MTTQIDEYIVPEEFVTMKPEVKAEWVADLRSGNFSQTRGVLCNPIKGGHCCLGVLSEQAVRKGVATKEDDVTDGVSGFRIEANGDLALTQLSTGLAEWAGIIPAYGSRTTQSILPFFDREVRRVYLDNLNDDGMPFSQIADLIDFWY